MKEIFEAQKEWRKAKVLAGSKCLQQGNREMAQKLSECHMFKGTESLSEMIDLMFSAQGTEFLITFGFPSIGIFRKFIKHHPEQMGVFIDAGEISLSGHRRAFLVGNTTAIIKCRETALYRIILMHGASAVIEASGYSVVSVKTDAESEVKIIESGNCKILK